MYSIPPILKDLLQLCEFIALFFGVLKFNSLKNSYWKWFVFYLLYIFIYEIFCRVYLSTFETEIRFFLSLIQIPFEFLFFFWLIGYQSLQRKTLFWCITAVYLLSFGIENYAFDEANYSFKSLSQSFGTLLMLILVGLEFVKQIKSDDILSFTSNKMFYINLGVILFYIGNMPFFGLYNLILDHPKIWNGYYKYFMISNCSMYLLFAASFIWGKIK
jgi:hypothetical protein